MVSSSDPRGKKLDISFSNPQWGELARTEGLNVLKDGVSDAFAVGGGGQASVASGNDDNRPGRQVSGGSAGSAVVSRGPANGSCDVVDIDAQQGGGHDHTATQA
ncbi:hypothetical protein PR003_g22313 [Phytophthora rubi]|uniref:Uncharacterized protein n=1 Tax=Phytophthora rubi TaxID=129364 RepID=A0A6A4DH81_9STRA|nr:hypothetical protein PR003_g22313 [Phytophthora rubi]